MGKPIAAKLACGEVFFFTWAELPDLGSGRAVVWLHPRT